MTLPSDLLTNQSKQVIVDYQLDHGRQVQGKKKKKKNNTYLDSILLFTYL
jgi:hypothetical protein